MNRKKSQGRRGAPGLVVCGTSAAGRRWSSGTSSLRAVAPYKKQRESEQGGGCRRQQKGDQASAKDDADHSCRSLRDTRAHSFGSDSACSIFLDHGSFAVFAAEFILLLGLTQACAHESQRE